MEHLTLGSERGWPGIKTTWWRRICSIPAGHHESSAARFQSLGREASVKLKERCLWEGSSLPGAVQSSCSQPGPQSSGARWRGMEAGLEGCGQMCSFGCVVMDSGPPPRAQSVPLPACQCLHRGKPPPAPTDLGEQAGLVPLGRNQLSLPS